MTMSTFNESMLLHNFLDTNTLPQQSNSSPEQPKPKNPLAIRPFAFLTGSLAGGASVFSDDTSKSITNRIETVLPTPMSPHHNVTLSPPLQLSPERFSMNDEVNAIFELWSVGQHFAMRSMPLWNTVFGDKLSDDGFKSLEVEQDYGDMVALHELWDATWTFLQVSHDFYGSRSKVALSSSQVNSLISLCRAVGQQTIRVFKSFAKIDTNIDLSIVLDSWQLCDHLYQSTQQNSSHGISSSGGGDPHKLMGTLELYVKLAGGMLKSANFAKGMDAYLATLSKEEAQLKRHGKSLILASWQVAELFIEYPTSADPDRILDSVWMLSADMKKTVHHQTFHRNWYHSNAMLLAENISQEAKAFVRASKKAYKDEDVKALEVKEVEAAAKKPQLPLAPAETEKLRSVVKTLPEPSPNKTVSATVPVAPDALAVIESPARKQVGKTLSSTVPPPAVPPRVPVVLPARQLTGPTVVARDALTGQKVTMGLFGVTGPAPSIPERPNRTSAQPTPAPTPAPAPPVIDVLGPTSPPTIPDNPLQTTCSISDMTTLHDLRLRILIIYALTRCGFKGAVLNEGRAKLRIFAQRLPKNCLGESAMLIDAATMFRNSVLDPNNIVARGDRACMEAYVEDIARAVIWKMQNGRWGWLAELFRIVVSCRVEDTERFRGKVLSICDWRA